MFSWTVPCIMNAAVTVAMIYYQKRVIFFKIHSVRRSDELAPSSQPLFRKYSSKVIM